MTALWARAWPELATLRVSGPDAMAWLNGVITCDVRTVSPSHAAFGLSLNRTGKIQSDVWVAQTGEELRLAVPSKCISTLESELDRMLIMEDAELENQAHGFAWFTIHGSGSSELASRIAREHEGWGSAFPQIDPECSVLLVPATHAASVTSELPLVSEELWHKRRIALNWPNFGTDYSGSDRPHEAGLERRAVSWTKGCYLGQEVVCMQDMRGKVKRSLRRVRVSGDAEAEQLVGKSLMSGTAAAGTVTSAAALEDNSGCLAFAQVQLTKLSDELSISETNAKVTLVEQ